MILTALLWALGGGCLFALLPRRRPVMAAREWNRARKGGMTAGARNFMRRGDEGLLRAADSTNRALGEARVRSLAIAAPAGGLGAAAVGYIFNLPLGLLAGIGAAGGLLCGYFVPLSNLREAARKKRQRLADGTAVYLDLAVVMMHGGMGMETALLEAAEMGEGGAFAEFRDTIAVARQQRVPLLDALASLGDYYQVPELSDLRRASAAASSSGAGVIEALIRSAEGLRSDRLRRLRVKAERRSAAMHVPSALLFFIMMGYLIYGILGRGIGGDTGVPLGAA